MTGTVANKKPKLEDISITKKDKDVEVAQKDECLREVEKQRPHCKDENPDESMEVTIADETIKQEEINVKGKNKDNVTKTLKDTQKKIHKKRENTPSTASEDETETKKASKIMEVTAVQSDEEDNGLLTAFGPVVASSTVGAAKQKQQQTDSKDKERDSSSDDGAESIYSIHKKNSSTTNTKTGERLTVTLAKNSNKKTANERLVEEHEKRRKMLHTMETYIRSILTLMQKDEEHTNNNEQSGDTDGEERLQITIPAITTLASSDIGIMSDTGSSDDDDPPLGLPKSPSATPPPLAPLSRGDRGLTIAKITSTATLSKTNKQLMNVAMLSMDDEEDEEEEGEGEGEEEEESDKQSDLNKSGSSTGSSLLANGDEASTSQIRSKVAATIVSNVTNFNEKHESVTSTANKEAEVISSPASPTEILTAATVDPTQL